MDTASTDGSATDGLVTLVDGTCKPRSELTAAEARELDHWNSAKAARAELAARRRAEGLPALCPYYDRERGEFCTAEGTHIGRGNEAGMRRLDFCEHHLKVWFT